MGVSAVAIAGLFGCAKPAENQPQREPAPKEQGQTQGGVARSGAKFLGGGSEPLVACPSSVPPQSNDAVYELTIGKDFDLRDAATGKSSNAKQPNPHADKTRLDFATDVYVGQAATIKITLTDPLLKFMPDPLAIRGGDINAPNMFCDPVRVSDTELTFRTYRLATSPRYATYNLGLVVTDKKNSSFKLPVFIDPGLENNGIAPPDGGAAAKK